MSAAIQISFDDRKNRYLVKGSGRWINTTLAGVPLQLERFRASSGSSVVIDVSDIVEVDSAGMVLLIHFADSMALKGIPVAIEGANDEFSRMSQLVKRYLPAAGPRPAGRHATANVLQAIGRRTMGALAAAGEFLAFLGENSLVLLWVLVHPSSLRFRAILRNIQDAGVNALPIVALTSFLIGVVIAYQGAVQLARFGGNIFIVDMIGISVTRELAPLITAIVVAGRTGSSYTAQIGVMKITQEIDAMRVMGFDPHRFLVQPRVIALMIALPLLIFFADIIGIAGGMFISSIHLDLSWSVFLHRLNNVLKVKHVWIGICKGPFFAWLIAIVGCFRGFQVSRNAESIGKYTTISVVNAIFLVIACDALFSVLLTELGI